MRIRSMDDLAAAVRGRRTDLALSQAELARRARVSRKSISELESAKTTPELDLVLRVLEQLDLDIDVGNRPTARPTGRNIDLDALLEEHRRR